jgi:transcriptional repressor NrdR
MRCPFCREPDTRVIDSRLVNEGTQIRRRRECAVCHDRFTTFESAELLLPGIIKRDGRRSPFDEMKLRNGFLKALEKRPISTEQIDVSIMHIQHQLLERGEREVSSKVIGELVMKELRQLDSIAFIRFASVYLRFQDIKEFQDAIDRLSADETLS